MVRYFDYTKILGHSNWNFENPYPPFFHGCTLCLSRARNVLHRGLANTWSAIFSEAVIRITTAIFSFIVNRRYENHMFEISEIDDCFASFFWPLSRCDSSENKTQLLPPHLVTMGTDRVGFPGARIT